MIAETIQEMKMNNVETAIRAVLSLKDVGFSTLRTRALEIADSDTMSVEFLNAIGEATPGTSKSSLRRYRAKAETLIREYLKLPMPDDIQKGDYVAPTKVENLVAAPVVQESAPYPTSTGITPARSGSKQAAMIDAMENGATVDELIAATGWSKSAVVSAIGYDIRKLRGYPVEKKGDKYFLGAAKVPHKTAKGA